MCFSGTTSSFWKCSSVWKWKEKTHLLTELLDRASPLYEVLKEAMLSLQVAWGEQPQVHDHVVWHILVVEGAQHLLQARLFLTQFDQVHELGGKSLLTPLDWYIKTCPDCQLAIQLDKWSVAPCSSWPNTSCTLADDHSGLAGQQANIVQTDITHLIQQHARYTAATLKTFYSSHLGSESYFTLNKTVFTYHVLLWLYLHLSLSVLNNERSFSCAGNLQYYESLQWWTQWSPH